jgi:predicted O-methyltransferase YrrM
VDSVDDSPVRRPAALAAIESDSAALGFAMSCEERTGSLLATLAASKPGGRVLELGTGTGAGAAWLLDGMTDDARLLSVEVDPQVRAVAVGHLGDDPRVRFETADADSWLSTYRGGPFDLAFVDCRPGKFHRLHDLLALLGPGGLYVGDDLLPQPTWPADHQQRVDQFLARVPDVTAWRATPMAWASGLVVAARV